MRKNLLMSVTLLAAAVVGAQENSVELDTIVVTASRLPIDIASAGSAVSVITRATIERSQAVSVADLLRDVPGIAVSRSGGWGAQTQLRVRGAEANHVLVIIDGVEANDPAIGDEFQFEHLLAADIERIEVVRGPQSALWGSDAVSGVINIITRRPDTPREFATTLEAGGFDTVRAGGRVGMLGERYEIGGSVALLDSAGSNISRTGTEEDGFRNATLSLKGQIDLSEQTRVAVAVRHTDATTRSDSIDFVSTGLPVDADVVADSRQSYVNMTAAFFPANAVTHLLKMTYLDTSAENLSDGVLDSAVGAQRTGIYYQGSIEFDSTLADSLTFALDHEQETFRQRGAATLFGDPNQDQRLRTTGYVLEYRLSPTDALNLSAAARHDQSSAFDSATTYRLTAAYALDDARTRLRGSFGTGQKSPTFIERFGFFADAFVGNPALEPETSKGWEIGVDRTYFDGRLVLGVTYFDEQLRNEINGFVFDPGSLQFTAANETAKSYRDGLEVTASAQPSERLSVTASVTLLDSTQDDGLGQQSAEIRRPEHMAALRVNYSPSERANINLNLSYNGTQYDTFFPPFPQPFERVELSSYRLVTLAGSWRLTNRIELFGRIENLLDEDYEDVFGFATPGVAAYVGLRTRR